MAARVNRLLLQTVNRRDPSRPPFCPAGHLPLKGEIGSFADGKYTRSGRPVFGAKELFSGRALFENQIRSISQVSILLVESCSGANSALGDLPLSKSI